MYPISNPASPPSASTHHRCATTPATGVTVHAASDRTITNSRTASEEGPSPAALDILAGKQINTYPYGPWENISLSWIARTPLQQLPRRPSVDERHYHDWRASIPTPYHQTTIAAVTVRVIQKLCLNSRVTGDATRTSVDISTAGF